MNLYFDLLRRPVFTMEDVNGYYGNINSARSAVRRLITGGMAVKIRSGLYTCISGETGRPIASRFQIASAITPGSCLSHHTALEYWGLTDFVFYEVHVASSVSFREFAFDGFTYRRVSGDTREGVERPLYGGGISVTGLERTIADSIRDMGRISGLDEVAACIRAARRPLQEQKLLGCLARAQNQYLYQKCGFLLWPRREVLGLSDGFFRTCREKMGRSSRYLDSAGRGGVYIKEWQLVVPEKYACGYGG